MSKATPIHVFIDTNVFLSFFAFTKDDVAQLQKLSQEIDSGHLKLYLPEHVETEFYRNREKKAAMAFDEFEKQQISTAIPRSLIGYPEAEQYHKAAKELTALKSQLLIAARKDAVEKKLPADTLFSSLCAKAVRVSTTAGILEKANKRRALGNPPGKLESLGDQVNWECLLSAAPKGSDLHVVSNDKDFESSLSKGNPADFLMTEWKNEKSATLHLHTEITAFLKMAFNIKLAEAEKLKEEAINQLCNSGSFQSTHFAISQLVPYQESLSKAQIVKLASAGLENSQISWISGDPDVAEFYGFILQKIPDQDAPEEIIAAKKLFFGK